MTLHCQTVFLPATHYRQLRSAIAQAHPSAVRRAAAAINHGLVLRHWLVGADIVEFEQRGKTVRSRGGGRCEEPAQTHGGECPGHVAWAFQPMVRSQNR